MRFRYLIPLTCCLVLAGCIDPIDLDVGPPENRLVVEALVREGPGPHYVNLSRSGSFTQGLDALRPRVRGAQVVVTTGAGEEVTFAEIAAGRYEPPAGALVGEVGQSYTLSISLADGTEYRSTPELMLAAPEVADFYAELEQYLELINGVEVQRRRVVLFADAERTPDRADYYRWMWSGTYAIFTCLVEECETCYRPLEGRDLLNLGDDLVGAGPVVVRNRAGELPLLDRLPIEVSTGRTPVVGWAFRLGFQITLEQQALDRVSHAYWRQVRNQHDNSGGLFDPPSESIRGNIARAGDPTHMALGHFTVVGATHRSACFDRSQFEPDWPSLPNPFAYQGLCGVTITGSPTPPPEWSAACGPSASGADREDA